MNYHLIKRWLKTLPLYRLTGLCLRVFGHAVLMARSFVDDEPFMVCAGDTYIISPNNKVLNNMINTFNENNADAVILL